MLDGEDTTLDQGTPDNPASGEVETSSPATDDTSGDLEQDLDAGSDQDTGDDASDDEEIEYSGEKYRIPKALKGAFLMQQDYTRKTQEVAETRKALESRQAEIDQQAKAVNEVNEDRKKLIIIDDWLERQSKTDWQKLWAEDPLDTPRKWAEYQHWKDQRGALASKIEQFDQSRTEEAAQKRAKRIQEVAEAARKIPGWSAEADNKADEYVRSLGLSPEQTQEAVLKLGAAFVQMAHEARIGRELIRKQQAAAKTPSTPAEPIKPLAVVAKGKAPARSGMSDDMSIEDWVKARDRQLRSKG